MSDKIETEDYEGPDRRIEDERLRKLIDDLNAQLDQIANDVARLKDSYSQD